MSEEQALRGEHAPTEAKASVPYGLRDRWLTVALALTSGTGILWALHIPEFEKPDEIHHLAYVQYVYRNGVPAVQGATDDPLLEFETQQPPVYYYLGAVVYAIGHLSADTATDLRPWLAKAESRNGALNRWKHTATPPSSLPWDLLAMRLLSIVFATIGCAATYLLCKQVVNFGAAAFIGVIATSLLPQVSYLTSAVSNDPLAWAWSAVLLLLVAHTTRRSDLTALEAWRFGILLGLCIYIKATLYSLGVGVLALAASAGPSRQRIANGARVIAGAIAVGGGWLARNLWLYGDLWGRQELIRPDLYAWNLAPKNLTSRYFMRDFWISVFESFIGYFGSMRVRLPRWQYVSMAGLFVVIVYGAVLELQQSDKDGIWRRRLCGILGATGVAALLALIRYNQAVTQPQGRYLYHLLPGLAVVVALGFVHWSVNIGSRGSSRSGGGRSLPALAVLSALIMIGWNLWALFAVAAPALQGLR